MLLQALNFSPSLHLTCCRQAPACGVKDYYCQLERRKAQFCTNVLVFLMPLDVSVCSLTKPSVPRLVLRLLTERDYTSCHVHELPPTWLGNGLCEAFSSFSTEGLRLHKYGWSRQLSGWKGVPVLVVRTYLQVSKTMLKRRWHLPCQCCTLQGHGYPNTGLGSL